MLPAELLLVAFAEDALPLLISRSDGFCGVVFADSHQLHTVGQFILDGMELVLDKFVHGDYSSYSGLSLVWPDFLYSNTSMMVVSATELVT